METKYEKLTPTPDNIVYVREVSAEDLPEEMQDQIAGHDKLFAVHSGEGERLAVVADRTMAFVLARQNHLSPVAVH